MRQSVASRASNASSQMLEELADRSTTKILRAEGSFNDEEMRVIWNALGLYINRNLRMGRGVSVPKLGVFTFTPPEVRLKGVTNQKERDLKPRLPVFLIQKQFIKGLPLKTAIFYHQEFGMGLRPYAALGATGDIPITKMNLLEVSTYANMSKDATQLAINRIIKYISEKLLSGQNVSIQIPHVGQFISRNGLVAIKFNEYLYRDTRTVLSKSLDERVKKGNMMLTTDNLKKFARLSEMNSKLANSSQEFLDIDDGTKNFLKTEFGFHTVDNRDIMKNSLTNFGRSFASRQFDTRNNLLKSSQITKMSQSGFLTNKVKSFNREYNMALRIVKEWVISECKNSSNSFKDFLGLIGKKNQLMNESEVWEACKIISSDITEQQSAELFRLLDANKDGFVTKEDWNKSIIFDTNALIKSTVEIVRRRNLRPVSALTEMGLAGISKTDVHTLKNALRKLNNKLNQEQALFLSRYITKGQQQVAIETILQVLQLNDSTNVLVDQQWQQKFLKRLRKKMYDKNILEEELESKLRIYDRNRTGFIEQTDLKTVLGELGISLTLSELVKIVKIFPINQKNHVNYTKIIEKLELTDIQEREPLTYEQFVKCLKEKFFNKDGQIPIQLPVSVRQLTSQLQSTLFKSEEQNHLIKFVRKLDVNQNDQISIDDINAYKEQIRIKKLASPEQSCPLNIQNLVIKLREKSIKKKISYYDLFKKLDTNKDGFITIEQWNKNIETILPLCEEEKQLLFDHLDSSKLKMIDYKTFLGFMNGSGAVAESEKFNWVEECIQKIQQWFKQSGLTVNKSFKLIDSDGDCYISEKDLNSFLVDKIKYQPRQLSHVRLQKILKVLDTFKRAKVDQNDWERLIKGEVKVNWINQAKQQIGIVLSRRYGSLSDAFFQISQGDQKLLFVAFKNWIEQKKILSGFIANQDILKKLYSELDVHKKGYLFENDFLSCFGVFNWKSEQTKQFLHKLKSKFPNCEQAYRCMNAYNNNQLDFTRFAKFVEELFGNRFKRSDSKNIWNNLAAGSNTLSLVNFRERIGQQWTCSPNPIDNQFPKDDWQYQDFTIIKGTQTRASEFQYNETEKLEQQVRKIVKNVKEMLAASPKSLKQAFEEVDTENTGKLNNLQFRKAFRILNIALTSKQLDLLVNYSDYKVQTLIDWKQFIKRFKLNEDEVKLTARISQRLQHISDLLHYYMITPKDAFKKCNNPRTGYMNFEQFHKMIRQVYTQASEPLPELAVLKETFQHIDIRRDDILDFQEFTQTFRNCNPPSLLMGTVPADKKLNHKAKNDPESGKQIRQKQIPQFKHSPQYQQFIKFIGRNRKYIQDKLESDYGKQQRLIPYEIVNKVIKNVASHNKLAFTDNIIKNSIAFSMTGEKVDYRLLIDSFKGRGEDHGDFPLKRVF